MSALQRKVLRSSGDTSRRKNMAATSHRLYGSVQHMHKSIRDGKILGPNNRAGQGVQTSLGRNQSQRRLRDTAAERRSASGNYFRQNFLKSS